MFDMDGLLADTEPLHAGIYVDMFCKLGLDATIEKYRSSVTIGGMSVKKFYESLGGDVGLWDDIARKKADAYKERVRDLSGLMPGVYELLVECKESGVPTAVVTSAGRRSLGIVLERFGLEEAFDVKVTYQDVVAEKPHPDGYLVACQKLDVIPRDCVAFEDSPRGSIAAFRAGLKCVVVPTEFTKDGEFACAHLVLESLTGVTLQVLEQRLFG